MLEFPVDYFDDEVRDGFYVPPIMKHCWAAQMEVINTLDEICQKLNIKYYLYTGTLLGAIRHGGYIPWDDDADVCMLRADYMKFIRECKKYMPERYYIRNAHEDPSYRDVFTRFSNDNDLAFTPNFWEKGHGFICNAGIDIFPMDVIPKDPVRKKQIISETGRLYKIILDYDMYGLTAELEKELIALEKVRKIKIKRDDTIPQQMYFIMEKLYADVKKHEGNEVQISLEWAQRDNGIPISVFENQIDIPYEITTFKAPYLYDKLLTGLFGQYMRSVRVCNIHQYPWYTPVYEEIQADGFYTLYEYDKELLPVANRHEKWQENLINELNETVELFGKASTIAEQALNVGDSETGNKLLEKCNQLAVNAEAIEKKLKGNEKERVVFLTWKADYWKYLEPFYIEEINKGSEVYVIPVPFIRMNEIHEQLPEVIEKEGFPEDLILTDFDEFNYDEVRISRIYTQNIFDNVNEATALRPFFHTTSIREYTDELIYIPWFELDEYEENDERALYMMKYFLYNPGITAVDKVILTQGWLKPHYVKQLTKWAGDDTKDIWENKIQVVEYNKLADINKKEAVKRIIYYIGTGQVLAAMEKAITKMESNFEVFDKLDKIKIKFFLEKGIIENIRTLKPSIYDKFTACCDKYAKAEWCEYIEAKEHIDVNKKYAKELVDECDVFYGDAGILMHMFNRANKPAMLQYFD